jgi:arginyl-tRNA synthetase
MYSAVRAANIFRKLESRFSPEDPDVTNSRETSLEGMLMAEGDEAVDLWEMILLMARINDYMETAVQSLELSYFAKYVFLLAQKFNNFYHKYPILNEPDPAKRDLRRLVAGSFLRHIRMCLTLMGIEIPEKM